MPADSSKVSEIERLVAEVAKHTDKVDILFANAGATWGAKFDDHPDNAFSKVMDLNVKSVFFTIQKYVQLPSHQSFQPIVRYGVTDKIYSRFAPLLEKAAGPSSPARVIVTGSTAGVGIGSTGANSTPAYSASKAAVLHLARNLAVELGPRGILVNGIAPGFFPSKMANGLMEASGGQERLAASNANGRLGQPEDIAAAVVYLSSRASGHVNGDTLVLDGGQVLVRPSL